MAISEEFRLGPVWAYRFVDGRAAPMLDPPLSVHTARTGWTWAHFALSDRRSCEIIQRFDNAPAEARELMLGPECSTQIRFQSGWTYGVLPDFEREFDGRAGEPGRLRFALDDRRLITVRRHPLLVVDELRRGVEAGLELSDPLAAFSALGARYFEFAEDQLDVIGEALDDMEDQILAELSELERVRLGPMRRDLARRHREVAGARTAYQRAVSRQGYAQPLVAHLPPLIQRAEDVDREIVSLQDRGRLLYEEIDAKISSATNRTLRALTIISTLLMPPTLIVGAFGMNLKGITFGDDPAGFAWACALCVAAIAGAYIALVRYGVLKFGK